MKDFARPSLIRTDFFGIDSIQGLLEMATWYNNGQDVIFSFSTKELEDSYSIFDSLKQLEKEGYITAKFSDVQDTNVKLESIKLTIAGHKLLAELRDKSGGGKLKKRLADLVWVIATSIVTTLIVIWIKGN